MTTGASWVDELRPGAILAGRYRLLQPLGEGAIGTVYLAEHVHMRKRYALKLLRRHVATPEVVWRFRAEAIAAANIGHPGIAAATDFGALDDGSLFLILEYVAGEPLAKVLERGPLPMRRALLITRNILCALDAAHRKGIVHRDVKPANVMVLGDELASATVKLLDFGIAKMDRAGVASETRLGVTAPGLIYGTAAYMPPEQARGLVVDARADLYSVGVVLYELISGRTPFVGLPVEVMAAHVATPPPPLEAPVARELTPEIRALVARLLEKCVADRPKDAASAIAELDDALRSLDAESAPPLPPTRGALPLSPARPRHRRAAPLIAEVSAIAALLLFAGAHQSSGPDGFAVLGQRIRTQTAIAAAPIVAAASPPSTPAPAKPTPAVIRAKPTPAPVAPAPKKSRPVGLRAKLRALFR